MGRGSATIVKMHKIQRLRKKSALFDRLPDMKLRAVPSRHVKVGHVIIDLHPEVYRQVTFVDQIMSELEKKIDSGEDVGIETVSRIIMSSPAFPDILQLYSINGMDTKAASQVLALRLDSQHQIVDKAIKDSIAKRLDELEAAISALQDFAKDVTKEAPELEDETYKLENKIDKAIKDSIANRLEELEAAISALQDFTKDVAKEAPKLEDETLKLENKAEAKSAPEAGAASLPSEDSQHVNQGNPRSLFKWALNIASRFWSRRQ